MNSFYQYLSTLTTWEIVFFALPIVLIMVLMPYFSLIFRVIMLTFRNEKPEILNFEILYNPVYSDKDALMCVTIPEYYIAGTTATLYWQVKGASRIDLEPLGKNVKGNSANIIIDSENRVFTLTVHGLQGKVSSTISIPEELVKQLDTEKISEVQTGFELQYSPQNQKILSDIGIYAPVNKTYLPDEIENYARLKQKLEYPINRKISGTHTKVHPIFRANYSLSKYNKIISDLKNNNINNE